jgi:hypothetical protein
MAETKMRNQNITVESAEGTAKLLLVFENACRASGPRSPGPAHLGIPIIDSIHWPVASLQDDQSHRLIFP